MFSKTQFISFGVGVIFGSLLAISIHYPVKQTTIEEVRAICRQQTFLSFKIGITGKVYEITCQDGQTYYLK